MKQAFTHSGTYYTRTYIPKYINTKMTAYLSIGRNQLSDQELLSSAPALFDCDDGDIAVYYESTPHIVPYKCQLTYVII